MVYYLKFEKLTFRKKNKSTDVLSFPSYEKKIMRKFLKTNRYIYIGDICINLDKIIGKNIKETRENFNKIWVHGFVHLMGYDHFTDKKFYKMKKIEKKIYNDNGLNVNFSPLNNRPIIVFIIPFIIGSLSILSFQPFNNFC